MSTIDYLEIQDSREKQRDPCGSDPRWMPAPSTSGARCPPTSFLSVNRKEWEELHQRLNGGVPVPQERQLSYCVLVLHCDHCAS